MMLNNDVISGILGLVDGITIANAGCVSSEFWSVAREEGLWEQACCSKWPSVEDRYLKDLISSSLGGFRKFYATCFPFIAYESKGNDCPKQCNTSSAAPSDFVSVVDVQHKDKVVFSKVVWGIPSAGDFEGWFSNCPFRIDILNSDEHHTITDGLPTIVSAEKQRNDAELWGQFMESIKLSWIVINRRTGKATNLSSWSPLNGMRDWPSDKGFVISFGSILPAQEILPSKGVHCKLVMKFRLSDGDNSSLEISELSMQFEDVMGARVNGRQSVAILERALDCTRTMNHNRILECHKKYLREQIKLREAKIRSEGCLNTLFILCGIVAFASFWSYSFRLRGSLLLFGFLQPSTQLGSYR